MNNNFRDGGIVQRAEISNSFLDDSSSINQFDGSKDVEVETVQNDQKVEQKQQRPLHPKFQTFGVTKLLFTTSFGVFYPQMDQLVTNLSLVNMGNQFGVDVDMTQWVLLTYLIVSSVCGAFIGRVGEMMGMDLMFKLAYLGLAVVNIIILSFNNIYVIYVARLFGGLFNSCGVATHAYLQRFLGKPSVITRLMSFQTTGMSIFNVIIPLVVGAFGDLGAVGWKYSYIVLSALVALCSILSFVFIPKLPRISNVKFDPLGICVFFVTIVSLIIGISSITFGWAWYITVILFAIFLIFLILFIIIEPRVRNPMIPPKVVCRKDPIILFIIIVVCVGIFGSKSMLIPYVCSISLQLSSMGSSLLICIIMVVMALSSLIVSKVFGKFITKALFFAGIFILSSGSMLMSAGYYIMSLPLMAVGCGIEGLGAGLFFVSLMTNIFRLGGENITLFSGLNNSFQNIGKSVFTAVVTMGLEVAIKLFLDGSGYDPSSEEEQNMEIYRRQYAKAAGTTGMLISVPLFISAFLTLFMDVYSGERGTIGFREKNLSHNKAQTTLMMGVEKETGMVDDHGLVEVEGGISFTGSDF